MLTPNLFCHHFQTENHEFSTALSLSQTYRKSLVKSQTENTSIQTIADLVSFWSRLNMMQIL